jgi:outer membrane autotransporter protein
MLLFGGFHAAARTRNEVDYLSGRLHAAYLINLGVLYLKPIIEGGLMSLSLNSFKESGAGGAGLVVEDSREKVWSLSPAIEIGSQINLDQGLTLQPFVRGGALWFSNGEFGVTASFTGSPAGVAPFTIPTKMDTLLAEVSAGIDIQTAAGAMIRLSYDGRLGEYTQQHGFGLKGSIPF